MLTRKQYRTIQQIKPYIIIAAITATTILIILGITQLENKHQNKIIEQYKQCIIQQSETQGYIIRSYCSQNYSILDYQAELEYIQKGYDLYLKQ